MTTASSGLTADVYDFAYYGQRRDLMDWGLIVASWEIDHPRMPDALATAATAAWTRGRLDEARRLATRGVAAAGGEDAAAAVPALDVVADLTMFEGRIDEAIDHYPRAASHYTNRGTEVQALCSRVAARQAMTYADRWVQAVEDLEGLLAEARTVGNPSALTAFEDVLRQWEQTGNEALQWWTLLSVVVLLERFDAVEEAAVLDGAILAAGERRPALAPDDERLQVALARARGKLGAEAAEEALTRGARFSVSTAVAHARRAITSLSAVRTGDTALRPR